MAKISVMSVMMINGHRSYYADGNVEKHSNKDDTDDNHDANNKRNILPTEVEN